MHRLLVVTAKGGTGKTTTVVNAGVELARLGHRILIADTDPQGHVATHFASYGLAGATSLETLIANPSLNARPAPIEIPSTTSGRLNTRLRRRRGGEGTLAVLPASGALNDLTATIAAASYSPLDRILNSVEDDYDLCLIDRQGALTVAAHMAIRAADSYLFVGEPAFLAYIELVKARNQLRGFPGRAGIPLIEIGYLATRTSIRSRRLREYAAHFSNPEEFDPPMFVFPDPIRQSEGVFDDPRFGKPSVLADPDGHAAQDYRRFAATLAQRLNDLHCFGAETPGEGEKP